MQQKGSLRMDGWMDGWMNIVEIGSIGEMSHEPRKLVSVNDSGPDNGFSFLEGFPGRGGGA